MIEHTEFDQLILGSALGACRRPGHSRQMQRHLSSVGDAIRNRPLKLSRQRQHGTKHLANRGKIVIGNPLAELQKLFIENGREIKRFQNFLGFYIRRPIMQLHDNSRQSLLPERHQHTPTHNRLHPRRDGVGERHVQRHRERDVAEKGHC